LEGAPVRFGLSRWTTLDEINEAAEVVVNAARSLWGKGCEIHPTAYVEASFLGDGVKVGAGATLRNSFVGDGAVIGDNAYAMNCVIGADCYITENTALIWVVCYPGSSVSNIKIQMCMIGRDVYMNMWCSFLDAKFVGDVMVDHRGRLVSSGTSFLGSCVGHRCVLGGKAPIPFKPDSLCQELVWNGNDDQGRPVPAQRLASRDVPNPHDSLHRFGGQPRT
jgi:UDP-3-O-[3-hydroxymyristoyl] glucosamine N-acyltransferase